MRSTLNRWRVPLAMVAALSLAGTAGFLTSQVYGAGAKQTATTVTINVATGPAGLQGPPGPPGPAGTSSCPAGFSPGEVVINHPGGQTIIWTCIHD